MAPRQGGGQRLSFPCLELGYLTPAQNRGRGELFYIKIKTELPPGSFAGKGGLVLWFLI